MSISKRFGAVTVLVFSFLSMIGCGSTGGSTGENPEEQAYLPLEPVSFAYSRWEHHLFQWLPDASPYETVEALIDDSVEPPLIHFFYTEREAIEGSKKQHHYVNSPELAAELCTADGDRECHHVAIDYERVVDAELPTFHIAVTTNAGAVDWTFVASAEPSAEYGAGLIDNSEWAHDLRGGLIAFYLEESALSSEESRVTFGEESYTVEEWPELSVEPYFTAYRGAYSRGVHNGYFYAYPQARVRTLESPSSYLEGAEWSVSWQADQNEDPVEDTVVLVERSGDAVTLRRGATETSALIEGDAIRTTSVAVKSANAAMTLHFDPPLPDPRRMDIQRHESTWELAMAGDPSMMSGSITLERDGSTLNVTFDPRDPEWTVPYGLRTRFDFLPEGHDREAWTTFPESP